MPDTEHQATLRPAEAADYPVIARWIPDAAACERWAGPFVPFPFDAAALPALLVVNGVQGMTSLVLSRGSAGAPLGFCQFWVRRAGEVHLGRIVLAPQERGRRLGRLLIESLVARAAQATSAGAATLRVHRDNPVAHAIYASLGFAGVPELSDERVLEMRLPLVAQ